MTEENKGAAVALPETNVLPMTWYDGPPPFPQDQEWFIAETTFGDRVVLRSLDEGREQHGSYKFHTADGTYMKEELVKRWMQFPDCMYLPPRTEGGADLRARLAAAEVEVARFQRAAKIAELKASGTLANNLCPDHRDKQVGQPCLACSIERLRAQRDEAVATLKRIERWFGEFPPGGYWPDGRPMSYGAANGSNGERDYMRGIARATLASLKEQAA